jgi:predicted dienelactone hydrolase
VPKLKHLIRVILRLGLVATLGGVLGLGLLIGYLSIQRNTPLSLPAPSGPYAVGRTLYDWVDTSRLDALAGQPNQKRELLVWVWYPAQTDTSEAPAPYLPAAWTQARDRDQGIGVLLERNFASIQTHSFADAPLASAPSSYPVLIMQPGMGPIPTDYTVMAENLASLGYVVAGINPTYTPFITVFPDGRIAPRSSKGAIPDTADPATADRDANAIGSVWADDVIFVMNQLASLNGDKASPFYERLDLEHIGVFGHSFGGATAIAVCQRDARCKAGADLDGTPWGDEKSGAVPQPFMFIAEDYVRGCDSNCEAMKQAYAHVKDGAAYWLSVKGTRHFNFSDLPLRQSPVVRPLFTVAGLIGSIDPVRAQQITNAYLGAFFDQYLKNNNSSLLSGPSPAFPEVQLSRR